MRTSSVFRIAKRHSYEKLPLQESNVNRIQEATPPATVSIRVFWWYLIIVLLPVSNLCTWYALTTHGTSSQGSTGAQIRSPYAGLRWDSPSTLGGPSPYSQDDEVLRDAAWDAINIDAGIIAVPDSFVAEHHLPDSQRFVWDQTKRVYLLNGYHSLHCIRSVYISLMEFKQGKPQTRSWHHVIHCIDQVRHEVVCNADDTPRYTTSDDTPATGVGQLRMCRSWQHLEDWAHQYNACYRFVNQTASSEDLPQIERFVWCPEGSPYREEVEKVFGHIEWNESGYTVSDPV